MKLMQHAASKREMGYTISIQNVYQKTKARDHVVQLGTKQVIILDVQGIKL
jgi:hypothetical protein